MFRDNGEFTVQDRIVLHLNNYNGFRDHYLNPESITQEGIAEAVGIARNHVPRALSGLKDGALVSELKGRVRNSDRRKKVYFLSEEGIRKANNLREKLRVGEAGSLPASDGFVGRQDELREIKRRLAAGRAVGITGPEGIGKTYLAGKAAQDMSPRTSVFWHNSREEPSLHGFMRGLAAFMAAQGSNLMGYRIASSARPDTNALLNLIAGARNGFAIVVDDFHLAEDGLRKLVLQVAASVREPKKLHMIIVSEEDIPCSEKISVMRLEGLDSGSVRDLLRKRNVTDPELVELCAGAPLLLRLVGPGRSQSIDDILGSELRAMTEDERTVMFTVSSQTGPIEMEMLADVSGADYQTAVNLAARGLLAEPDDRTFDAHSILKDFFWSRLDDPGKRGLHLAAARYLLGKDDPESCLRAQDHMLWAGENAEAARAIMKNGTRIIGAGRRQELEGQIGSVDLNSLEEDLRADLLLLRGFTSKLKGEWKEALEDYGQALLIFRNANNSGKEADALAKIGRVHLEKGEFDRARECFDEGLGNLGKGPHIVRARILDEMATIHLRKKEIEEAKAKVGTAMEEAEKLGDGEMEARIHNTMGNLHMTVGSLSEAKEHYELSLEGLKEIDEQMAVVLCNNLAIIEFKTGNVDKAIELWELAAGKAETMKSLNVMLTFSNLGSIYFSIGNWDRAAECCTKALEISEMVGKDMITASARSTLGHLALYRGQEEWLDHYGKALELRGKLGDVSGQASSHNDMARAFVHHGRPAEAEEHGGTALALALGKGDAEEEIRALLNLAGAEAAKHKFAEAKGHLKRALLKSREMKNNEMNALACLGIGRVSALEGEDFPAEKYLGEAVALLDRARRPLHLAIALREQGVLLHRSGLGEPAELLSHSAEIFKSLGLGEKPWFVAE